MINCEYILCSAIWYKDLVCKKDFIDNVNPLNVDKGLVFCGFRHLQCMRTMSSITGLRSVPSEVGKFEQGFLTSENRFVDRIEGMKIAINSKQVEENKTISYKLFSEDLW